MSKEASDGSARPVGWIKGQTSDNWRAVPIRDPAMNKGLDEIQDAFAIPKGFEAMPLEYERHATFASYTDITEKERDAASAYADELIRGLKTEPELGNVEHMSKKAGVNGQKYDVNCLVVTLIWPEFEEAFAKFDKRFPDNTNPPKFRPQITLFRLKKKDSAAAAADVKATARDFEIVGGKDKEWIGLQITNPKMVRIATALRAIIKIPAGYHNSPVKRPNHITLVYGCTPAGYDRLHKLIFDELATLSADGFVLKCKRLVCRTGKPTPKPLKEGHPTYPVVLALSHTKIEALQKKCTAIAPSTREFHLHTTLLYLEADSKLTQPLLPAPNTWVDVELD
jgi:2'-5' RNA ligase